MNAQPSGRRTPNQPQQRETSATEQRHNSGPHGRPVGVVVAGAVARGAYEAGVLSVLLPELEKCGQRPTVFVGTSAGAINAALFASLAHLPAQEAADRALALWRAMHSREVFKPVLLTAPFRYFAGRLTGLLDNSPLLNTLKSEIDWQQLHKNTQSGLVQVAVAATDVRFDRTAIFVEGPRAGSLPVTDDDRAVDYFDVRLGPEHVLASSAVPVGFPPVQIENAWYVDGGVRLNAPIKPAVALGVERVFVVASNPDSYPPPEPAPSAGPPPLITDVIAEILSATLVDRMIEDFRTLEKVNKLAAAAPDAKSPAGRLYRVIDGVLIGPSQPGTLGRLASQTLARFGGVRALQHLGLTVLSRLLGSGASSGELLSYLFFEPEFAEAAILLGVADAKRTLPVCDPHPSVSSIASSSTSSPSTPTSGAPAS
jgi:NTE family protein